MSNYREMTRVEIEAYVAAARRLHSETAGAVISAAVHKIIGLASHGVSRIAHALHGHAAPQH